MGEVVNIKVAAANRSATVERAWERFVDAMQRSKETLKVEDGIEAGKAYREFLELWARAK